VFFHFCIHDCCYICDDNVSLLGFKFNMNQITSIFQTALYVICKFTCFEYVNTPGITKNCVCLISTSVFPTSYVRAFDILLPNVVN
jgi:hypothetical protein